MIDIFLMLDFLDDPDLETEFIEMYQRYEKTFMEIAMSKVHNHHIAEECVIDALEAIAKKFSTIQDPFSKQGKSYVCRIVENISIDTYNRENRRPIIHEEFSEEDYWEQSEKIFVNNLEAQELSLMLEKLPEDVQTYLSLHYINKLTLKEIGEIFNISYYKLSKTINEALEELRGAERE